MARLISFVLATGLLTGCTTHSQRSEKTAAGNSRCFLSFDRDMKVEHHHYRQRSASSGCA